MDIRSLKLSGICIWLFCNLKLVQEDASAPPVIYHSIKPLLYYNLIFANGLDQSYACNCSRLFRTSVQLQCVLAWKNGKCFQVCAFILTKHNNAAGSEMQHDAKRQNLNLDGDGEQYLFSAPEIENSTISPSTVLQMIVLCPRDRVN